MKPSILLKVFSSAVLLFPVVADALEMPQPKLGQWEKRVQYSYDGAPRTLAGTTQLCWTAVDLESGRKILEEAIKNCSKNEVRKEGSKWINNSVCKLDSSTVTAQMTREFNGENAYHDDMNLTFNPPLDEHSRVHMVTDGKWLGPCK